MPSIAEPALGPPNATLSTTSGSEAAGAIVPQQQLLSHAPVAASASASTTCQADIRTARPGGVHVAEDELAARAADIGDILGKIPDLNVLHSLIDEYYSVSQATVVPADFLVPAIADLVDETVDNLSPLPSGNDISISLVQTVLRSTTTELVITPETSASEFYALHNGKNLRIETVGLICTVAARACFLGFLHSNSNSSNNNNDTHFVATLAKLSERCLR